MLRSSNILKINSINSFEQLFIFFGLPVLFLLLIMKLSFLITINFHKNSINNKKIFNKTKTIMLQFSLWFLAQFFLFLLPIQEMVINIHFLDLENLPLLSLISILHLVICFSFLSHNNQIMKVMRFTILSIIVIAIILQFNFTMIKLSLPSINNFVSLLILVFFYYWLCFFSWKMFSDNLFTIFNLMKKTRVTLFSNSSLSNMINKQFPVKLYTKTKIIILTWQFKKQLFTNFQYQISIIDDDNKNILIAIYKKNLTYFLSAQLTTLITKTIQYLKTLISGWKMALIQ